MLKIAFWIFLLLSANVVLPTNIVPIDIRDGREILNGLGIIILLVLFLSTWRDKIKPLNKIICAFWFWAVVTAMFQYTSKWSFIALVDISLYILLYWMITQTIKSAEDIQITLDFICVAALIQVAWCVIQYLNLPLVFHLGFMDYGFRLKPEYASYTGKMVGTIGNPNLAMAFLAISFPAFMRHRPVFSWPKLKWLKWWWFIPAVLFPFWQTHTRGALVSLACGVVFWLLLQPGLRKWVKAGIIGTLVLITAGYLAHFGVSTSRLSIYKDIYYLSDHSFVQGGKLYITKDWRWKEAMFGHGLGQFKVMFPSLQAAYRQVEFNPQVENHAQAHNEPLQVKFEMGNFGLGIAMAFIILLGIWYWRVRGQGANDIIMAGIVIICVNSLVNFPFHDPALGPLLITYLAMIGGEKYGYVGIKN